MILRTRNHSNRVSHLKRSTAVVVVFSFLISTLLTPFAYSKNTPTDHKLRSASKFLTIEKQYEYNGTAEADIENKIRAVSEQLHETEPRLNVIFYRYGKTGDLKPLNLLQGTHEWVKGKRIEWKKDWKKWWLWNFLYYATSPISGAPNTETPLLLGLVLAANHFLIFALLSDPIGRVAVQVAFVLALSGTMAALHGDLSSNKQTLFESPSFTGALKKLLQPFWQRTIGEILLIAPMQFLPFHIGFAISWAIHFTWNFGIEMGWWKLPHLSFFGAPDNFPVDRTGLKAPKTFDAIINSLGKLRKDEAIAVGEKSRAIPMDINEEGILFFKELFNLESSPTKAYLLTHETKNKDEQRPYGIIIMADQPYFLNLSGLSLYQDMNTDIVMIEQANFAAKFLFPRDFVPIDANHQVELKKLNVAPDIGRDPEILAGFGEPFEMLSLSNDKVFSPNMGESIDYQQALFQQRGLFPNKTVLEIGVGSGVGLLYAFRFGARAVSGTDISAVHALVTRWNLEYAQETGQIPPIPQGAAKVVIGNGFASLPNHDFYLWNTPGISFQDNIGQRMFMKNKTLNNSFNIATDQFLPIFYELKERLMRSNSKALWRILPYRDSGLVEETDQDILDDDTSLYLELNFAELFRDRAERFIRQESLTGKLVSHDSPDVSSNIYLLKAEKLVEGGGQLDWSSKIKAIDHVRNAVAQNRPSLIDRYDRLYEIEGNEDQVREVREEAYRISSGDFINWGLGDVLNPVLVPHFRGDFRRALAAVFDDPRLKFSIPEMKKFGTVLQQNTRKPKRGRRERPAALASPAQTKLSELLERYKQFNSMDEDGRILLRSDLARHLNIVEVPAQLEKALILEGEIREEIKRVWGVLSDSDRKVLARRPMIILKHINLVILSGNSQKPISQNQARSILKYAMEFYGAELLKQLNASSVEFTGEHPVIDFEEDDEDQKQGHIKIEQPLDNSLRKTQITLVLESELKKRFSKAKLNRGALMGFVRDEHGKIQPVFSKSAAFESVRDVDSKTLSLFQGWDGDREMRMVPLKLVNRDIRDISTSAEWGSLPDWLKDIFSAGKILQTSLKTEGSYSVLMAVGEDHMSGRETGRSGVLLKDGMPVVLEIAGREFVVEIKGVGTSEGGFDYKDTYLRGGAVTEESDLEYENLEAMRFRERFQDGFMPRALANLHFINQNGEVQGYLMRLSPGTVRASFNNNPAYDFMSKIEKSRKIAYEMGREIGEHLSQGFVPLSHAENLIVLNTEFDCAFTDYYDVRPLHHFPFEYDNTTLDLHFALRSSLHKLYEIKGFRENNGFQYAIQGLGDSLLKSGKISEEEKTELLKLKDHAEITSFLWAKFIASDYYLAIRKYGFSSASKTYKKDYPSLRKIVQNADRQYLKNRQEVLDILKRVPGNWEERIAKLERKNRLLAMSEFTPEGMVALINSEDSKAEFFKVISTLKEEIFWSSDYFDLWVSWGNYTHELLAIAAKIKKEIEFLRIVLESAPEEFKKEVSANIALAQKNLTMLQEMTPHDYYLEIQKNRNFSKQILKLPYHTKVKTKTNKTKKKKKQKSSGGIIHPLKDFAVNRLADIFPSANRRRLNFRYDIWIAPWLENLLAYVLTFVVAYFVTGGNVDLSAAIASKWGWGTFVALHLLNFIGKDGARSPPANEADLPARLSGETPMRLTKDAGPPNHAIPNLILSIIIAGINSYFGISPQDPLSYIIHFFVNLIGFFTAKLYRHNKLKKSLDGGEVHNPSIKSSLDILEKSKLESNEKNADLKELVGDVPNLKTFEAILKSLGEFSNGFQVEDRPSRDPSHKLGRIQFVLNDEGVQFFEELLDTKIVNRTIYLLTVLADHSNERIYLRNMNVLPYGFLLEGNAYKDAKMPYSGIPYFVNISRFFLNESACAKLPITQFAEESSKILFPEIHSSANIRNCPHLRQERPKRDLLFTNYSFNLLTFDSDRIYPHTESHSRDFQKIMQKYKRLFRGKSVLDIGVGTGVEMLYALRYGARLVSGTDISPTHVMLAKWNMQFAQETGQIPPITNGTVEIRLASGFGGLPPHDIYLFNTPAVRSFDDIKTNNSKYALARSLCMTADEFKTMYDDLKERLINHNSIAIWKMLLGPDTGLVYLHDKDIPYSSDPYTVLLHKYRYRAYKFIVESGLVGKLISEPYRGSSVNIYLLHSPKINPFPYHLPAAIALTGNNSWINPEESLQNLYNVWLQGESSRDELIYESRKLGFDGLIIENDSEKPLRGNHFPSYASPRTQEYVNTYSIYHTGIKENNHQHTYGNGVFFWRETLEGYEYLSFDWGQGAIDSKARPIRNIRQIFSNRSYRRGKPITGLNRLESGDGMGLARLAEESFIARVISLNNGQVHIADKSPGQHGSLSALLPATQKRLVLPAESNTVTGFAVHGFAPFFKDDYKGRFSSISDNNTLGIIETKHAKQIYHGEWQAKPAQGLDELNPRDNVTFVFYEKTRRHEYEQREFRGILREVPSSANQGVFVFEDGFIIGYNSVKEFRKYGATETVAPYTQQQDLSPTQETPMKRPTKQAVTSPMLLSNQDAFHVMVKLAQKKVGARSEDILNSRILYIESEMKGDAVQAMPFKDNEFDTAYSSFLFDWGIESKNRASYYLQAAKEIGRVLKPEGKFFAALGLSMYSAENLEFLNAFKEAGFEITELGTETGYYLFVNKKINNDESRSAYEIKLDKYFEEQGTIGAESQAAETNAEDRDQGGVMGWLKDFTIKLLFPSLPENYKKFLYQNYSLVIAPWLENLLVFAVSSLLFGLPVLIFTGDITQSLKVSYFGTWPILAFGHTSFVEKFYNSYVSFDPLIDKLSLRRATNSENLRDAVIISSINIALGFLPLSFPTIIFLSFAVHFAMNLVRAIYPNIGFYLKMAFVNNNGLIVNAFDVSDYSKLELGILVKQIKLAYKTDSKIIIPLFTNKDKMDIFEIRQKLITHYGVTDEMLGNVCFGGVVITRKDLLPFQTSDPAAGFEAEALYSVLKVKLLELKRLDSELFVQVFTSNENLFKVIHNLEKRIRILLIESSSKVRPLTPIFEENFQSKKLIKANQ